MTSRDPDVTFENEIPQRRHEKIWQCLERVQRVLPDPLREQPPTASLGKINYGYRVGRVEIALDALECLAEINDCSPQFYDCLAEAQKAADEDPTFKRLSISPLVDHPKNKHVPHRQALSAMTDDERRIVGECLRATIAGPFFPEVDFFALFGHKREEFARILEQWPEIDDADKQVAGFINNSMNHLLGYPHHKEQEWPNYISVSPKEVLQTLEKWRKLKGWGPELSEGSYITWMT